MPDPCPDVFLYTNLLPLPTSESTKSQKSGLRANVVNIWNSCNLISAAGKEQEKAGVAKLRTFAFLLLASITSAKSKQSGAIDKLFQNSLIALRECLQSDELDLAERIVEHVAGLQTVSLNSNRAPQNHHELQTGVIEYHCLRLLLESKRRRDDLADRCYFAMTATESHHQEPEIEKVVDLFYETARDCLAASDYKNALKWLERGIDMLDHGDFASSFLCSDLRLNILHSLGMLFVFTPAG